MVYIDDGEFCFKTAVPAETAEKAKKYCDGNGEIVAVKDVTDDYPIDIDKVCAALRMAAFGSTEIDLIQRTLTGTMIAE